MNNKCPNTPYISGDSSGAPTTATSTVLTKPPHTKSRRTFEMSSEIWNRLARTCQPVPPPTACTARFSTSFFDELLPLWVVSCTLKKVQVVQSEEDCRVNREGLFCNVCHPWLEDCLGKPPEMLLHSCRPGGTTCRASLRRDAWQDRRIRRPSAARRSQGTGARYCNSREQAR